MLVGVVLAFAIGWFWFGSGLRRNARATGPGSTPAGAPAGAAAGAPGVAGAPATPEDTRKIRATLFYVADNGAQLVGVDREVPYADGPLDQARKLVEALVEPVQEPLAQAIPAGTRLRAIFMTETGDAFVDFSPEIAKNHPGGSLDELLTVYAIVNTITVNLPAITRVQILIDGKEVDTLAGHVDLRRPLAKNLIWSRPPDGAAPPNATPVTPQ
jgi:spore germination protein GerM